MLHEQITSLHLTMGHRCPSARAGSKGLPRPFPPQPKPQRNVQDSLGPLKQTKSLKTFTVFVFFS